MGKLYDSLKQRSNSGGLPAISGVAPSPRLQVVPVPHEPLSVDDHEPMPFFEVPSLDEAKSKNSAAAKSATIPLKSRESKAHVKAVPAKATISFAAAESIHRHSGSKISESVIVVQQPDSSPAREYREMAAHLSSQLKGRQARSLTLLPLERQQPAAVLAANLGCAWAEMTKHPLVLIDAARSLHHEGIASLMGLGVAPGWEELMMGSPLAESIQQTGRSWLDIIASGQRLARTGAQTWAKKAGNVMQSLNKHYRAVLLLGPAYPLSPLGLVLAENTDSTCLLLSSDQLDHPQKDILLQALAQQNAHVLGTIVLDK